MMNHRTCGAISSESRRNIAADMSEAYRGGACDPFGTPYHHPSHRIVCTLEGPTRVRIYKIYKIYKIAKIPKLQFLQNNPNLQNMNHRIYTKYKIKAWIFEKLQNVESILVCGGILYNKLLF